MDAFISSRTPRVTVVLPVWNAGEYLAAAVESIRAQTLADWEMLAIDDGSTDGSRQVLVDFARSDSRIVVTSRPNRGLAATLQEGIERSRTGIVALMNADDVAHPDRLTRQLDFLERHPTVAALGTQTRLLVDGEATPIESRLPLSPEACRRFLPVAPPLAHPTVMLRREAVLAVGGYRPQSYVEDYDLWLRLADRFDLANLPDALLDYRLHDGQFSSARDEQVAVATLVVRAAAAERRAGRPDPLDHGHADRATATGLGIRVADIVAQVRGAALGRAEQVLAATGSPKRADRELAFLDDHWTATADPRRWQATRDWLAGRGMLTRGDRLGALRSLVKAAAADPALACRLATAAIRRRSG